MNNLTFDPIINQNSKCFKWKIEEIKPCVDYDINDSMLKLNFQSFSCYRNAYFLNKYEKYHILFFILLENCLLRRKHINMCTLGFITNKTI